MCAVTLVLLIFGLCYLLIMTERLHKTIVALFGAEAMISLGGMIQEEAFCSGRIGQGPREPISRSSIGIDDQG